MTRPPAGGPHDAKGQHEALGEIAVRRSDIGAQRIEFMLHVGIGGIVRTSEETPGLAEDRRTQSLLEQQPLQTQTPAPYAVQFPGNGNRLFGAVLDRHDQVVIQMAPDRRHMRHERYAMLAEMLGVPDAR